MESVVFDGTYQQGSTGRREPIVWRVAESAAPTPPGFGPSFEIVTSIRGVGLSGSSFDLLDPESEDEARQAGLTIGPLGLTACVVSGRLPCLLDSRDVAVETSVDFVLDLRDEGRSDAAPPPNLRLSLGGDGGRIEIVDHCFEDGMLRLQAALPADVRVRSCATCRYSGYPPGGHGLIGMSCHRDAKDRYLAVTSKADRLSVPITEEVIETYLCAEYARRVSGTASRG